MYDENRPIDVICQHTRDGKIIPIKIRLQDDDGEFQVFRISSFRPVSEKGVHYLPGGVAVGNSIWCYECRFNVFNREKTAYRLYNISDGMWVCRPK